MGEPAGWRIEYYLTANGRSPVVEEVNNLPVGDRAKVYALIDELQRRGLALGKPLRGKLYELRPVPYRVLYFAFTGRRFVMLRCFRKKSRQTPESEMALAEGRMDDYITRFGE